jgi:diguanylate cyclase (GGDEF)-like protein/PAS domain S-box-containing protein
MNLPTSDPKQTAAWQAAREQVEKPASNNPNPLSEAPEHVLHELRVHQIELELQNEELRRTQAALELSQERYINLFDLAPVGYITISEKGLILEANLTAANLLGVARNTLIKHPLTNFIWPEDQDIFYLHCKQLFKVRSVMDTSLLSEQVNAPQIYELRLKHPDGAPFWARLTATAMQDADGAPACWLVLNNISEIKQTEIELRETQVFNQKILGATPGLVYIYDLVAQQEIFINRPFAAMLGYSFDQEVRIGSVFLPTNIHPDDAHILQEKQKRAAAQAPEDNPFICEYRVQGANNDWHWIGTRETVFRFTPDGTPSQILGIAQDITERKLIEVELFQTKEALETANCELQRALTSEQQLARSDGLTGLYNYRHFHELAAHEFQTALRYQQPLTILMFDADGFKRINDTLGHIAGDQVLMKVAHIAAAQLRAVDVLARYGGDEFVVLLHQTTTQQALPIAERMRESVAALKIETDKVSLTVTLSIGIAEMQCDPPDECIEQVIQRADQALYMAKINGRNRTVLYD